MLYIVHLLIKHKNMFFFLFHNLKVFNYYLIHKRETDWTEETVKATGLTGDITERTHRVKGLRQE